MNRDLESTLRNALRATATSSVPDDRTPPAFERLVARNRGVSSLRLRWAWPSLAAAVVLGMILTTTLLTRSDDARRVPGFVPLATTPVASNPPPTMPLSRTGILQPTRTLSALGMNMTVPLHWVVTTGGAAGQTNGASKSACVAGLAGSSCVLNIVRNESPTAAFDPDRPAAWISSPGCATAALTEHRVEQFGSRSMEYRRFAGCGGNPAFEQWTASQLPQFVIWHPLAAHADEVVSVLRTIQMPPPAGPLRVREAGLIASFAVSANGIRIGIRTAVFSPAGGLVATQDDVDTFLVPTGTRIACWLWHIPNVGTGDYCPAATLADLAAKGPHPDNGALALGVVPIEVFTDGNSVRQVLTKDSQQIAVIKP